MSAVIQSSNPAIRTPRNPRERVLGLLRVFRERHGELLRSNIPRSRLDLKVFKELKPRGIPSARLIGAVPGVEVGDRFEGRAELVLAGLHGKLQNGIDWCRRRRVATCVVATQGNYDKMNDPDVLVYRGEGGRTTRPEWKRAADQVMKDGNLAMKKSTAERNEVRVIRGLKAGRKTMYFYDGLYEVVGWKTKTGDGGNMVFDFEMRRKLGQARINWKNHTSI